MEGSIILAKISLDAGFSPNYPKTSVSANGQGAFYIGGLPVYLPAGRHAIVQRNKYKKYKMN